MVILMLEPTSCAFILVKLDQLFIVVKVLLMFVASWMLLCVQVKFIYRYIVYSLRENG